LLLDLKEEVQESCSKYGTVKKVVVYDNNPEGVVTVTFETTLCSDMAVKMLNGRIVDGRRFVILLPHSSGSKWTNAPQVQHM
uniref:RRM domain-containing protein n=1 Tax=Heligmosomoides polygyrus TaxID=6339 RepID=A0A183GGZ5_HELPZ